MEISINKTRNSNSICLKFISKDIWPHVEEKLINIERKKKGKVV